MRDKEEFFNILSAIDEETLVARKKMKVALAPEVQKTILDKFDFYEVKMSQKFKITQYF